MVNYYGSMIIQRIIFPIILTICVLIRPVVISLPYLFLLLYIPFVPIANPRTIRGHTKYFFILAIAITSIIILLQIAFQILLVVLTKDFMQKCDFFEYLFRHIGMIRVSSDHILTICLWYLPDVVMFLSSIILYILVRKMGIGNSNDLEESELNALVQDYEYESDISPENFVFLRKVGSFFAMVTLLLAAVLRPSIPGGLYFLVFLCSATWWACYRELEKGFAIVCRIVLPFLVAHIMALLTYQTPWPQEYLSANDTVIRFLGFSPLIKSYCNMSSSDDIRVIIYNDEVQLDAYLNPIAILLCYFTLAITSGFLLNAKPGVKRIGGAFGQLENGTQQITQQVSLRMKKQATVRKKIARETWHGAADKVRELREHREMPSDINERTPLMRRSMKRLKTFKQFQRKGQEASTDAGAIPLDELPGDAVNSTEEEQPPTICEHIYFGVGQVSDFIFKNSYILTNITMMVWSIVYHSWLTFVFLLLANILWIVPNQRKNMLRCCPFIVIYAEFLLLAQYIYGMNLTEDELPSTVDMKGINMAQIGFIRYPIYPCGPLLLKSIFTLIFWITLRQKTHEAKLEKQTSTLVHLAAPFQLTVSAATTDLGTSGAGTSSVRVEEKKSKLMLKAGALFKSLLVQLWIWIVMLALFLCAIYGKQMTAFRITYMALFLIFLITFQCSWRVWKTMMYAFLVFVIGFAMLTLIMIYTYQFDRFNEYWTNYTGIPETLQQDIGMEKYETKDLFLNLVSPTIVVIITVVQLQYFHKKYLEIFNIPPSTRRENSDSGIQPPSSINYGNLEPDSVTEEAKTGTHSRRSYKISDIKNITSKQVITFLYACYDKTKWLFEIFWLILEIHLIKVILLIGFYLGMEQVSVIHISLIVLATLACTARTSIQTIFSRIISVVIALLLLLKMIYQIQYIDHNRFDFNCSSSDTNNTTNGTTPDTNVTTKFNDADWMGFRKINQDMTLGTLLQGYIAYIFVTTIHALILFRQKRQRRLNNKPMIRPKIIFPRVTRADADKDLAHMIKYLFNFAFYKFGIEITLMMVVALIGARMDIVAICYSIWLWILFACSRQSLSRIWPAFKWFNLILITIQYFVVVGLPPSLCYVFKWDSTILKHLQEWAWLPDLKLRVQSDKLLLDFLLLLFTCRQMLVFRIEKQYDADGAEFPGGTNKSVVEDINNLGKVPLTSHDFITYTRNWLDLLKRGVLIGLFWITLAIVFLAGTNRVNIFSIGYLIGSFIFLWQGADFYLRPINNILKWWGYLLGYNIFVITMKAILQIPGCIFISNLGPMCWSVQLFGISCIRKFTTTDQSSYNLPSCLVPKEDVGLVWDGICFGFLIIQYRLFQSHYFCHIINESKASTILASRGAELIEQLRRKQVRIQGKREEEILQKIKQKMDRIKANQQRLQPTAVVPKTHYDEVGGTAPLARTTSLSSCAGYHTPIEDEVVGEAASDLPSDLGGSILSPRGESILTTQAPSPSSAIMTVSLEGYLEPQRLSFGSPPCSELMPHLHSSEDSYPVFSPLHCDSREQSTQTNTVIAAQSTPSTQLQSVIVNVQHQQHPQQQQQQQLPQQTNTLQPGVHVRQHRRQSSLNTVSWTDQGDRRVVRTLINNLNTSNEENDGEIEVRLRRHHRRQSSMAISWNRNGGIANVDDQQQQHRRRYSYASWVRGDDDDDADDEISTRTSRTRPYSWGPVGEFFYRESLCFSEIDRSPISHQEYDSDEFDNTKKPRASQLIQRQISHPNAVRSGDYYLFEDLDEKVELDLIHQRPSASVDDPLPNRRLSRRLTMDQVLENKLKQQRRKKLSECSIGHGTRRASLPEEHEPTAFDPRSTYSEPITPGDKPDTSELSDRKDKDGVVFQTDDQQPSTSKDPSYKQGKDDLSEPTSSLESDDEVSGLSFIRAFITGVLVSITLRLYKLSRNYRYVMRVLTKEKKELKADKDFGQGHRIGSGNVWAPLPSVLRSKGYTSYDSSVASTSSTQPANVDGRINMDANGSRGNENNQTTIAHLLRPNLFSTKESQAKQQDDLRRQSMVPEIRILAPSLERGLDDSEIHKSGSSSTDSLQDVSETEDDFYSQDHSILTDLVTSMWFAIISNTDLVCYLFVFIYMVASASLLALPIPFMVFLWGTLSVPRPSKTFWVTIIAYTQIVVLIKSFSQFGMLWWNDTEITPNRPLAAARIIGVERKQNYADYDLALLLVVFFHRFVLKQMGIWRTGSSDGDEFLSGTYAARPVSEKELLPDPDTVIVKQGDISLALTKADPDDGPPDDGAILLVSNVPEAPKNYFPKVAELSSKKYFSAFTIFFRKLLKQTNRVTADVYVYIFLCDFINFFVLLFGFTAFGSSQGDGGVASYLTENKIPMAFLFMLLLQFVFIIVDRALYLRKNLAGKIIFQFISVIGMHIWLFLLVPYFSERSFNVKAPPVIYYIVKCFYFLFSAYQIRCGYPRRILGNCLTKGFSLVNLGAFKVYMATPFLFELRTLMDWIWTDTSMPLFEWLKMEDIFANIYELKCSRQMEKKFPAPRGVAKGSFIKYIMGGGFLFAIIALVWGPLALFALGNTVGAPNVPYEVQVSLKIGSFEPLYIMGAQSSQIHQFREEHWQIFQNKYKTDRVALTFMSNYEYNDVAAIVLGANSTSLWMITPPDMERLKSDLHNNETLKFRYKYSASRVTFNEKMAGTIFGEQTFELLPGDPTRYGLFAMLNNTSDESIILPHLFPKFLKVSNQGDLTSIPQLLPNIENIYRDLYLKLHTLSVNNMTSDKWWSVLEVCGEDTKFLNDFPYADCDNNLVLYTFSDKLFPATLSFLTAGGVIGLYTTFVFVMSRFFRGLFAGGCHDIMYSELPYVDRILQLCLDIYLVRESMEFDLEEDLFAKLIFVYRSPETMIRWTRPADEQSSDEATDDDHDDDNNDNEKQQSRKSLEKKSS